mmetsp:Transcript_31549/g.94079  ORF Transcript_31549/g.94079 Transcript_31549/m.94079 type:complete len:231 (-) Transcript_31549:665-1357(-)
MSIGAGPAWSAVRSAVPLDAASAAAPLPFFGGRISAANHRCLSKLNTYRSLWNSLERSSPPLHSLSLTPPKTYARFLKGIIANEERAPGAMPARLTLSHASCVRSSAHMSSHAFPCSISASAESTSLLYPPYTNSLSSCTAMPQPLRAVGHICPADGINGPRHLRSSRLSSQPSLKYLTSFPVSKKPPNMMTRPLWTAMRWPLRALGQLLPFCGIWSHSHVDRSSRHSSL